MIAAEAKALRVAREVRVVYMMGKVDLETKRCELLSRNGS
jgi:hypothetical protein